MGEKCEPMSKYLLYGIIELFRTPLTIEWFSSVAGDLYLRFGAGLGSAIDRQRLPDETSHTLLVR